MAKKQIPVTKFSDKLSRAGESFTVNMYDNGYMIEVSGKDLNGDWATAKIMCGTVDELVVLIKELSEMERDS